MSAVIEQYQRELEKIDKQLATIEKDATDLVVQTPSGGSTRTDILAKTYLKSVLDRVKAARVDSSQALTIVKAARKGLGE